MGLYSRLRLDPQVVFHAEEIAICLLRRAKYSSAACHCWRALHYVDYIPLPRVLAKFEFDLWFPMRLEHHYRHAMAIHNNVTTSHSPTRYTVTVLLLKLV